MTPTEHAAAATTLLAQPSDFMGTNLSRNARLAQVHAVLSHASGTGAEYSAAEAAITSFASVPSGDNLEVALAHALLAATA